MLKRTDEGERKRKEKLQAVIDRNNEKKLKVHNKLKKSRDKFKVVSSSLGKKRKLYDEKFITEIMLILRENEWNMSKTSTQTEIPITTLKYWKDGKGMALLNNYDFNLGQQIDKSISPVQVAKISEEVIAIREEVQLEAVNTLKRLIKAIDSKIDDKRTNARDLGYCADVMSKIILKTEGKEIQPDENGKEFSFMKLIEKFENNE